MKRERTVTLHGIFSDTKTKTWRKAYGRNQHKVALFVDTASIIPYLGGSDSAVKLKNQRRIRVGNISEDSATIVVKEERKYLLTRDPSIVKIPTYIGEINGYLVSVQFKKTKAQLSYYQI